jgi:hypothetical protein
MQAGGHGDGGARHWRRYRSGTHGCGKLPRCGPPSRDHRRTPRRPRGRRQGARRRRDRGRQHRPCEPRRGARAVPAPPGHDHQRARPARRSRRSAHLFAGRPRRGMAQRHGRDSPFGCADRSGPRRSPALRRLDRQCHPRASPRGQRRGRVEGRDLGLDRGAGHALRHSRHHRQCGGVRAQRRARLRRPVAHAGSRGRGDRPALVVPSHACGAAHHGPDAARQPGGTGQLRRIFRGSPRAKRGDRPALLWLRELP